MSKSAINHTQRCGQGWYILVAFALALVPGSGAFAQVDSSAFNLYQVSTIDFKVNSGGTDSLTSVSSLIPLSAQDAPGPITIFTKEEIKAMGARDLIDLLNLVPGFSFGVDVEGIVTPGVRGNLAQEAILMVVDGVEMNELLYGATPMMNRFPIDQFEKVEVIRGPGSSVHGGFATYAVINITTKAGNETKGFNISNMYGRTNAAESRQSTSLSIGTGGHNWNVGAVASMGRGVGGNGWYNDRQGGCFNMAKSNSMTDRFVSTFLEYKGITLKYVANKYHTLNRDSYNTISQGIHNVDFDNQDLQLRYKLKLGTNTEIIPQVSYTYQKPWITSPPTLTEDTASVVYYDRAVQRISGGATLNTSPTKDLKFSLGLNERFDKAINHMEGQPFYNGKNVLQFNILSVYAQAFVRTRFANVIVGGRLEKHNKFLPVFAPRIALSRHIGNFTTKVGYTQSYKMPTIENYNLSTNQQIKPQHTSSLEGEVQYAATSRLDVFMNVFKISTHQGIVYMLEEGYKEDYTNCGTFSTKGMEAGAKARSKYGDVTAAYSFYTTQGVNTYKKYEVPGQNVNLAYPAHKLSLSGNVAITKNLRFNTTLIYNSARYSFDMDSAGMNGVYCRRPSTIVVNTFLTMRIPIGYGLEAGVGVKDLFNQNPAYLQAYNSFHRPLPGLGREYLLRITYELTSR